MIKADQSNAIMLDIYLRTGATLRGSFVYVRNQRSLDAFDAFDALVGVLDTLHDVDAHLADRGSTCLLALWGDDRELIVPTAEIAAISYFRKVTEMDGYPIYRILKLIDPTRDATSGPAHELSAARTRATSLARDIVDNLAQWSGPLRTT